MTQPDPHSDEPGAHVSIWLTFPVIATALIAFAMGQTVFFVILPSLARVLNLEEVQVGAMISLAAFIIAAVSPWWGRRSDIWGRRAIIVFGLMSYAITMIAFCVAAVMGMSGVLTATLTFMLMLSIRGVYALLTAGIQPAATAYVAEATSDAHRTAGLAMVSGAIGLGSVLGPVFGGVLIIYFGLIGPLVGVAILAFAVGIAVQVLLPRQQGVSMHVRPKRLSFFDPRVRSFLFMMLAVMVVGTGAQMTAGFYIIDVMQVSEKEAASLVAQVMAAAALAMLGMQGVFVQIFKLTPAFMVRSGLFLATIGFGLLIYPWVVALPAFDIALSQDGEFQWILSGFIFVGMALGLFNPGLMAALSLSVSTEEQGSVAGLLGSAMAGGFVIGPVAATFLYGQAGKAVPFLVGASLLALLFIISLIMRFSSYRYRDH